MYKLMLLIWNKEQLPTEWLQGIICPIYKKGERTICSSYRLIMLFNIAYKIFTIILNNRLSEIVESKLGDVQSRFRPNRSALDNIFIVRQTFEKCYEYNIDLHNIFVDYIQAFDSLNRNKVIDSLNQYNIPSKLKKLIVLTLTGTNAVVKINNEFTEKRCPNWRQTGGPIISYTFQHCHGLYMKENGIERKHLHQTKAVHYLCRRYLNNY
jgi:sorting nexin-29